MFYSKKKWCLPARPEIKRLFLCEGDSEAEYVDYRLSRLNPAPHAVKVLCFEGLTKIDAKTSLLVKEPGFQNVETICVFLDAEQDIDQTKRNVRRLLAKLDFPNSASDTIPWVESDQGKTTCVFISPNMKSNGRIENIVLEELKTKQETFGCIEAFRRCAHNSGAASFDEKSMVASYILMNKPGIGLGAAFKKGYFDTDHEAYSDLNNIINRALT